MINPKKFKSIPSWLLGGFWINQRFTGLNGEEISTKDFGSNKFHGRTHPSTCYMAIMRFTEEGDYVYIPFAGSGTEVDICNRYHRHPLAIDINDYQTVGVSKADATTFCVPNPNVVRLIIAHPPYENAVHYGDNPRDLSKKGQDYINLVKRCAWKFYDNLAVGGKLVLIIGSVYRNKSEIPLDYVWHNELSQVKFRLIGRIIRDFGETKGKGKNENLWKYRLLKYNRFYLKNDFVMIYEKVK